MAKAVDTQEKTQQLDIDYGWTETRSVSRQWIEYILLNLVYIMWLVDGSLLQIFAHQLQVEFKVTQTELGSMATFKGWTTVFFALPAAFMAENVSRPRLIFFGCTVWGLGLVACGAASAWPVVLVGRMFNGAGLGLVKPLVFSLVADKNRPSRRGTALAMLFFSSALGTTIMSPLATGSAESIIFGLEGWRFWCVLLGVLSILLGVVVALAVCEPNDLMSRTGASWKRVAIDVFRNCRKLWQLFKYPTFVLLCLQGGPGSMPWQLIGNFPQWLELMCFSNPQAGQAFFGWNIGLIISNVIAGLAMNFAARKCPRHGPPSIANFSAGMSTPALILIFYLLPKPGVEGPSSAAVWLYTIMFLFCGSVVGMCGAVNSKIMADFVPKPLLTYGYAMDTLLEGVIGSLGPLAVGFISAHVFHLDEEAAQSGSCNPEVGVALGNAMFTVFQIGWGTCFLVYVGMQFTYPRDCRRLEAGQVSEKGTGFDEVTFDASEACSSVVPAQA